MPIDDDTLRSMLRSRASRIPPLQPPVMTNAAAAPIPRRSLGPATLVVGTAFLGFALLVGALSRTGAGREANPTGLWQSEQVVGTGVVGADTCVAVQLTHASYSSGQVQLWWWAPDAGGCRTATSSPMESTAKLSRVPLPGTGALANHTGIRVELELQILPSGTELLAFTLDPLRVGADSAALVGMAGVDPAGRPISFRTVAALDVALPGGGPAPTPALDD